MQEALEYARTHRRPRPVLRALAGFAIGLCLATSCGWMIVNLEPLWFVGRILLLPYFAALEHFAPEQIESQNPMVAVPPLVAWFLAWGTFGAIIGFKRAKAGVTE